MAVHLATWASAVASTWAEVVAAFGTAAEVVLGTVAVDNFVEESADIGRWRAARWLW